MRFIFLHCYVFSSHFNLIFQDKHFLGFFFFCSLKVYRTYDFPGIVDGMSMDGDMAYDSFTNVARKLFAGGACNWGRIVALFLFGYTIACRFIRQGPSGIRRFLKRIVKFVIEFLFKENIAKWIMAQGGWVCVVQSFIFLPTIQDVLKLNHTLNLLTLQ